MDRASRMNHRNTPFKLGECVSFRIRPGIDRVIGT